jgi:mannose-6-phosphate isomerase-like protein (cupin superfamily)
MKTIDKPWGKEEILTAQDRYVVKRIRMKDKHRCSLQYHHFKTETIYILYGTFLLHLNDKMIRMQEGDFITILPKEVHRMTNIGLEWGAYLESSTTELDDVVRLDDDYER